MFSGWRNVGAFTLVAKKDLIKLVSGPRQGKAWNSILDQGLPVVLKSKRRGWIDPWSLKIVCMGRRLLRTQTWRHTCFLVSAEANGDLSVKRQAAKRYFQYLSIP